MDVGNLALMGFRLRKYIELRENWAAEITVGRGRSLISTIALLMFAVCTGRRHFPEVNNVPSTSVYYRSVRRYIPHGYCDDYMKWTPSNSISHTYIELVFNNN